MSACLMGGMWGSFLQCRVLWSNVLGMVEAGLFMPGCEGRFSSDARSAMWSFLWPFLILPVSVLTMLWAHPEAHLSQISTQILIALYIVRLVLYLGLVFGLCYAVVRLFGHSRGMLLRFVTAHNYLALPPFLVALPLMAAFWQGAYAWDEIYPMMVFLSLYGYACLGYVAMRIFKVPFEMGISAGALALVLHQGSLSLVKVGLAQALLFFA